MSPQVALCEMGSRRSSAGGFRRPGLALREAGWTASRRARIAQAGPGRVWLVPEDATLNSYRSTLGIPRVLCAPSELETRALIQSTGESVV